MSNEDSTTAKLSNIDFNIHGNELSAEQFKDALYVIGELASTIEVLADKIIEGDETGYLNIAVYHLALKIGGMVSLCGGSKGRNVDQWMLPFKK